MSRADPSKRSMTTPLASGKFLSGSASITSPTVHFQPLAACLYTLDLLTSSLNCEAHWSEKALTAISSSLLEGKVTGTLPHVIADRDRAWLHHPAVHPHPLVVPFDQQAKQRRCLFGRVRVHGDHLAPLAAARHLQLRLSGVDGAAEPAQLLLGLEAFDVEVGAEPPRVERHAGLQREGLDRGEVDDQHLRVVEVLAW